MSSGAPVAKQIAALLGQQVTESARMTAFVRCQGDCEKAKSDYQYSGVEDCKMLSEKASTYIANSSTCFHFALDEEYNQEMFNAGVSNFNEAIKCINYMGDVLQKKQSNK